MNKKLALSLAFLSATGVMSAQAEVLETTGVIGRICSFGDTTDGTLAALPSLTVMSSDTVDGGVAATIAVTNNSPDSFALFVSTPSSFTGSPEGLDISETTYATNYALASSGAAVSADSPSVLTSAGTDSLAVINRVDNGSNMFIAGAYALSNTVTCAAN